jgi:lipopolysaccharide export system protein LptA
MNLCHEPNQTHPAWLVTGLLLCLFMLSTPARALDPNSKEPITIESDSVTFDDQNGFSRYLGSVVIRQGASRLEAEQITVRVASRQIVSIEALGQPAHFVETDQQKVETHGYASTIQYVTESGLLTLQSDARLIQGDHSFSGDRIVYDARRKSIHASGNKQEGERVRIQFQPGNDTDPAGTEGAPEPTVP